MSTKSWAVGAALLPAVVLTVVAWRILPSAPDRVPVHWGIGGQPDGFGPPEFLVLVLGLLVLLGTAMALSGVAVARDTRTGRLLATAGTGVAALATATATTTLVLAVGTVHPERVTALLPVVIGLAAMTFGLVPWVLLPVGPVAQEDLTVTNAGDADPAGSARDVDRAEARRPAVMGASAINDLARPEAVEATIGSPWATALGWVVVVAGIVVTAVWPLAGAVSGILTAMVGIAVVWLGHARVRVDPGGLSVTSLGLGCTLMRVPIEDVETVVARDVSAGEFGGWGLRVRGRAVAYLWRSGPGLVVTRRNGSTRIVVFGRAPEASGVLRRFVAERASEAGMR